MNRNREAAFVPQKPINTQHTNQHIGLPGRNNCAEPFNKSKDKPAGMKPDYSSIELYVQGQMSNADTDNFENIIVAGAHQSNRSRLLSRSYEVFCLSQYQFGRRDRHMDFIRRHNIQHFRLLSNQKLSSAVSARLLPPISKLSSRHEAILNCLRQEQFRKDNNSYLSQMLRDDVIKSAIHKYGLSSPAYNLSVKENYLVQLINNEAYDIFLEQLLARPEHIFSEAVQSASDPILGNN